MIGVLVVDDNPVIRSGLVSLLEADGRVRVLGEATNGKEAVAEARKLQPRVVLCDVRMPVMDGVEAAGKLAEVTNVLMLTYAEDADIVAAAVRAGASGYLVHGRFAPDELVDAIERVAAGESVVSPAVAAALFSVVRDTDADDDARGPGAGRLTEREVEVIGLIAQGLSNQAIANRLFLGEKTVKNHINRLYGKLGVSSRAEAIALWLGTRPPDH